MSLAALSPVQDGNPWAYLAQGQFAGALAADLPPGTALIGVETTGLLQGIAAALATFHADAAQLTEVEMFPATTNILLPYWEQDYGLPDCCTPLGATLQQRRNTLQAKIAQVGGQNEAYYIAVAAALGWAITITRGSVGGYAWTIHASATAPLGLLYVGGEAGDYLETIGTNTELECVMNQIKPAHSVLTFSYS